MMYRPSPEQSFQRRRELSNRDRWLPETSSQTGEDILDEEIGFADLMTG